MVKRTGGTETFPKLLVSHAARLADAPALSQKRRGIWHTMTWRELAAEIETVAAALEARGLERGGTVVLLGDNRPRLYVTLCAIHALGAVAAPMFHDAKPAEVAAAINMTGATHAYAQDQEQVDKLLEVLGAAPSLQTVVFDEDKGMRHYRHAQLVGYDMLRGDQEPDIPAAIASLVDRAELGEAQDDAFVFFTESGGTTKGVVHSHASLIGRARAAAGIEYCGPEHVVMAFLSPAWSCQTLFGYAQPMAVGTCVCFPESIDTLLADLREMAPHYFLSTPRMLDAIASRISVRIEESGGIGRTIYHRGLDIARRAVEAEAAGTKLSIGDRVARAIYGKLVSRPIRDALGMTRIRAAYTAGDAIDPARLAFFRALGINVKQVYGSTETGYFDTMQRNGEVKANSVGRAVDGVELTIADDGEVMVRSPGLCKAILAAEGRSAPETVDGGWLATGDVGEIDAMGNLSIVDRKRDIGSMADGTAFAPRPVENRLRLSPNVREAVIVGAGRDQVCALIDIHASAVGSWADTQGLTYTGHADLVALPAACDLIAGEIAAVNRALVSEGKGHAQIKRFVLLPAELSVEDGMLTRSGRLRRDAILDRYSGLIDALFGGAAEVALGGGAPDEGEGGAVVRIHDVAAGGAGEKRRAA
ncbi:MAG: AMP-binding protein [Pseudomonadota bacterium]